MVSAQEYGTIRFVFADSQEINPKTAAEVHTSRTSGASLTYPTGATADALPLMPRANMWLNENGKLVVLMKGDAADIVESEESGATIPVILKEKSTGITTSRDLRLGDVGGDFSDFNSTNDVTLNTSVFVRLGAYTVPAGYMLTFDGSRKLHIYIGDDTV